MGFEGQLSDADRACMHEREEREELDRLPLYGLELIERASSFGDTRASARLVILDDATGRWEVLAVGVGKDARTAIRALRFERAYARAKRRGAREREATNRYLRSAGINPRAGVFGGGQ